MVTVIDYLRRSARISRREKIRNNTIRDTTKITRKYYQKEYKNQQPSANNFAFA